MADKTWFKENRFGLFMHWGLYSLPARHEWVRYYEEIPSEDYDKRYFDKFNPDLFDPEKWADYAWNAGMRYFVFTTKHHEGFCMWDSKWTDYKVTNTPFGKDAVDMIVSAFRKKGFRIGLYYSLDDWHHPDFPIDDANPLRNLSQEEKDKLNQNRNPENYIKYMQNQVREILTNFGQIDEIWFDSSGVHPLVDFHIDDLYKLIRKLQPNIIINNRGERFNTTNIHDWDIQTPECYMPLEWVTFEGEKVDWELCHSFNNSWGYYRNCGGEKTQEQLISMLVECVSKGGNLLLNAGPNGRGEFEPFVVKSMKALGEWMKFNSEAIYDCIATEEFESDKNTLLTYNPKKNRLYAHLFQCPSCTTLKIKGDRKKVKYAQFLHDKSELKIQKPGDTFETLRDDMIYITIPIIDTNITVPVVEIFLED